MRFTTHPKFDRELSKAPADVYAWAVDWMESVKKGGASFRQIVADASPLKGRDLRDHYVRKWRRKKPHGEYRLVFYATEEDVVFVSLESRGGDYKTAIRRIRAMS